MCVTSNRRRAASPAGSPGRRWPPAGAAAPAIWARLTADPGSPRIAIVPSAATRSSSAASSIRAASCLARPATAVAAACTALPATTVERDAQEPDAQRVGGDLGKHGLDALPQRGPPRVHVHDAGLADNHVRGVLRAEAALF